MLYQLIQQILEQAGYNVITASNNQKALDQLNTNANQIDLVLTDIVMPQLGGQELIAQLRQHRTHLKVLGMSGYTDPTLRRHNFLDDCDSFIQKPFTKNVLLNRLAALLKLG